jgi:hypothetical protein
VVLNLSLLTEHSTPAKKIGDTRIQLFRKRLIKIPLFYELKPKSSNFPQNIIKSKEQKRLVAHLEGCYGTPVEKQCSIPGVGNFLSFAGHNKDN